MIWCERVGVIVFQRVMVFQRVIVCDRACDLRICLLTPPQGRRDSPVGFSPGGSRAGLAL